MSKEEIKHEISQVLEHFSDKALNDLLIFLKGLETQNNNHSDVSSSLSRILLEDKELLQRLAQ